MDRRDLLGALGVAAVGGVGGCLDAVRSGATATTAQTSNRTETPAFDPDGTAERVDVGTRPDGIRPHGVVIWNAHDDARSIHVEVIDADAGAVRHDRSHRVPADAALAIHLRAPAAYRVTVRLPSAGAERTISVSEELFDRCNESYTHVSVYGDGTIGERTTTTELQCVTETSDADS